MLQLSSLLPNYLPWATNMSISYGLPIEGVHLLVITITLTIFVVIIVLKLLGCCLGILFAGASIMIICLVILGFILLVISCGIPGLIIGIPAFFVGRWLYRKMKKRQFSKRIGTKLWS